MNQQTLPHVKHSKTSKAAADSMKRSTSTLRVRLLEWLAWNGPHTDSEMQELIPMNPNTQRPRRRELQQRGLIEDSGEKRKTKSGRFAVVWRVK